jgi:hypothetical protein
MVRAWSHSLRLVQEGASPCEHGAPVNPLCNVRCIGGGFLFVLHASPLQMTYFALHFEGRLFGAAVDVSRCKALQGSDVFQ